MSMQPPNDTPSPGPQPRRAAWKRWLLPLVKLLVVVAVIYGVRRTLLAGLDQLGQTSWSVRPGWLVLSGLIYLVSVLPAGVFWHRVLRAMGQDARLGETLRAYYVGHIGKYVPGRALVIILRAGLISSHRVDPVVAGVSVFVETLTLMSVGAFLAAAILPLWFRDMGWLALVALGLMLAAGLPTLPPVFRFLLRMTPVVRRGGVRLESLSKLRFSTLLFGWISMGGGWFLNGTSLWAVMRAIDAPNVDLVGQLPLFAASVALATVVGFVSMIPGGALVREAALVPVLARDFGPGPALAATILLRLVFLVTEVLNSGILYCVGPRPPRSQPTAAVPPEGVKV